jgi:hypothetical protein
MSNAHPPQYGIASSFAMANYAVGDTPDIAIGDCDADSWIDLIYINAFGTAAQLQVRRNMFGALAAPIASSLPLFHPVHGWLTPLSLAAGDFNDDGLPDVSVSAWYAQLAPATSDGDCTFTPQPYGMTATGTRRQRTTDFDRNGTLDVVAAHGVAPAYSVAWGDDAGSFNPYSVAVLPAASAPIEDVAFADFSGDGVPDVLLAASSGILLQRGKP